MGIACGERVAPPRPLSHLSTTGKYCPEFKIKGLGCPASRDVPPEQDLQPQEPRRPTLQSPQHPEPRLSFKPWLATTSRRGGASPGEEVAGGWAGLSPSRVPQGTPGHLLGSRTRALPLPSASRSVTVPTQCAVPARGSLPSARRYPGAQSLKITHLVVPPEHSHPPDPWACQPRVGAGGAQGSPRAAAAWDRDCPVAHVLFSRAPTSALAAVTPRDSSGPPPSTRRPIPRRVPTRRSTPKAHALSHASARLGGN